MKIQEQQTSKREPKGVRRQNLEAELARTAPVASMKGMLLLRDAPPLSWQSGLQIANETMARAVKGKLKGTGL